MDGNEYGTLTYSEIIKSLYRGILGREPDEGGFQSSLRALQRGMDVASLAKSMIESAEFNRRRGPSLKAEVTLPNLIDMYPDKYYRSGYDYWIYKASSDADFQLMEHLISEYRYYDSQGVWSHEIDLDKRVTAAIVQGLGAKSCMEFGCFNGSVISLLKQEGIEVCGVEVSHLAMLLAHPNVYSDIRYGDLCELDFHRAFDAFLAMDILEHISPLKIDNYVKKISYIIGKTGFAYINSPSYGDDGEEGNLFRLYHPQWDGSDGTRFWREIQCDEKGWPLHGHLIWANEPWWEALFVRHGLVRDKGIEAAIHELLIDFFQLNPGRKMFYVLRHQQFTPNIDLIKTNMKSSINPLLIDLSHVNI